jgi:hypothetical protein
MAFNSTEIISFTRKSTLLEPIYQSNNCIASSIKCLPCKKILRITITAVPVFIVSLVIHQKEMTWTMLVIPVSVLMLSFEYKFLKQEH